MPPADLFGLLKKKNVTPVIRELLVQRTLSRSQLSSRIGLSPATASSIVRKLEQENIVQYIDWLACKDRSRNQIENQGYCKSCVGHGHLRSKWNRAVSGDPVAPSGQPTTNGTPFFLPWLKACRKLIFIRIWRPESGSETSGFSIFLP